MLWVPLPGFGLITKRFKLYGVAGDKTEVLPNVSNDVNKEWGVVTFPNESRDVKNEAFDVIFPKDRFEVNKLVKVPDEMFPKVKVEVNRDAYLVVMFSKVSEDIKRDLFDEILPKVRVEVNRALWKEMLPKVNRDVNKGLLPVVVFPNVSKEVKRGLFPVVELPNVRVDVKNALLDEMFPNVRSDVYNDCQVFSWDGGASVVKQYQFDTLWVPSLI